MPMIAIMANLQLPSSADKNCLLTWIAGGENLEAEVGRCNLGSRGLALRQLAEGSVGGGSDRTLQLAPWRWRQGR